jgi:hypothetical protein
VVETSFRLEARQSYQPDATEVAPEHFLMALG